MSRYFIFLVPAMYEYHTCTVGWSDFHFFLQFSKTGTLLSIGYIFMSSIPKNRRILQRARGVHARQNFYFKKITGTLKMNIFFLSWQEPSSYIKDQLPKIDFKIRGCLVFFLIFQKWQKRFLTKKIVKKIFFEFLFIFSVKKGTHFVSGETFKNVKEIFLLILALFWRF